MVYVSYDISIIRPQIHIDAIKMRGEEMPPAKLRRIKRGLLTLHLLELMATNIYRYQITNSQTEHNRQLIAAMCNEMTHYQDYQVKLLEYGWRPSSLIWLYWILGSVLGFSSRLRGKEAVLKAGVWVETRAVRHYAELLRNVDWDEDTRKVVEKNQADEEGHIRRWQAFLESKQHVSTIRS
jgi:demethoxyubiquinone hydroxylase (CLK1/Coq7/Cat5 family)